jgi:hypothetical protein
MANSKPGHFAGEMGGKLLGWSSAKMKEQFHTTNQPTLGNCMAGHLNIQSSTTD